MKGLLQQVLIITALALSLSACTKTDPVLERASKFENATDYAAASRVYSEGLKSNPDNPVYLWRRAYACLKNGEIDETLSYCEKQLKKNPEDANALMLKARCYQFLRFQELPKRIYEKALALSPSDKTLEERQLLSFAYGILKKEKEREKILQSILKECRTPGTAREFNFRGDALWGLDRFYEARNTYRNGLRKYPRAGALNLNLGALYCYQNNTNKGMAFLEEAIESKFNPLWAKAIIGYSLFRDGEYEKSIKCFDEVLEQQPNYLSLRYSRLEAYAYMKMMDKAEEEMKAILSFEPDNTWAIRSMSTAYDIDGDKKMAANFLNNKLDTMPGNAEVSAALADVYVRDSEENAAMGVLHVAIKAHPECAELYYMKAGIHCNDKYFEKALEDIEKAISYNKHIGCYYSRQAEILRQLGKYRKALSSAQTYYRFYPWDSSAKRLLAESYIYNKQYKKAVKIVTEVIDENPDDHHALLLRSVAIGMLGNNKIADADFKKCFECTGHDKEYWYYSRGIFSRQLGNYKQAINSLSKAIEVNKKNEFSWCARGCSYYKIGEYQKAIRDCNKSLAINPKRVHPHITRGSAYREIGLLDDSLKDLNKAISRAPKWGEAYYERSRLYAKYKQSEFAEDDLKKAISLGYIPDESSSK